MAKREEGEYVDELAVTVNEMFADGKRDPNASDIANAHFGDRPLGGEIVEGIRKRLHKIRKVLEEVFEQPVCLLGKTYYTRYRNKPIATEADARRCLPIGHAMAAQGIYLPEGADDLIYRAALLLASTQGTGKVKKVYDRTLDGYETGRLTEDQASEIISATRQRMIPDRPELAERLTSGRVQPQLDEAEDASD